MNPAQPIGGIDNIDNLRRVSQNSPSYQKALRAAAEEFEAVFAKQMLEQSRQSKLADELFGGNGSDTFRSMLDQEYARNLAHNTSLGIAEALVQQLNGSGRSGR